MSPSRRKTHRSRRTRFSHTLRRFRTKADHWLSDQRKPLFLGFWFLTWMAYRINNLFFHFLISSYLSANLNDLLFNITTVLIYFWVSYYYVRKRRRLGYRTFAWSTGFIWLLLTVVSDFVFWRFALVIPWSDLYKRYELSFENYYYLNLLGILVAIPLMRKLRNMHRRNHSIFRFFKKLSNSI